MFNKKIKKEVDFVLFRPPPRGYFFSLRTPPSGRERLYIGRIFCEGKTKEDGEVLPDLRDEGDVCDC